MKTAISIKTLSCSLTLAFLGVFFGVDSASAQFHGVQIDGRNDIFIPGGTLPDKRIGTLFKRRGDIQRFRIRNGGTFCWNLGIQLPGNFSVRIAPSPNPLQPGTTSTVTIAYEGGATPPGSTFAMFFIDCDNPLHGHVYAFGLGNTPKKGKGRYGGDAKQLTIRDKSGPTRYPDTPIIMDLPLGRGAFNGTLFTSVSGVFTQDIVFQGRVQDFTMRRGGKKMIIEGYSRWKLQRLGFPGLARGNFRWNIKTNNKKETVIGGLIRVSSGGKSGPKSKDFSLSTRFRGKLQGTL